MQTAGPEVGHGDQGWREAAAAGGHQDEAFQWSPDLFQNLIEVIPLLCRSKQDDDIPIGQTVEMIDLGGQQYLVEMTWWTGKRTSPTDCAEKCTTPWQTGTPTHRHA